MFWIFNIKIREVNNNKQMKGGEEDQVASERDLSDITLGGGIGRTVD